MDEKFPISPEYITGSTQTSSATVANSPQRGNVPAESITTGGVLQLPRPAIELGKYGVGKPRRVIVRGRIAGE